MTAEVRYVYRGETYNRKTLERVVGEEAEALDPAQWFSGEFEFDEWLSDSITTGTVTKTL